MELQNQEKTHAQLSIHTLGVDGYILVGFISCIRWSIEGCHLSAMV